MNFTAKVFPFNGAGNTKAFATLVIDDVVAVKGFKVVESRSGDLFVGFPSTKGKDKEGNEKWYNDVQFYEDVEEGQYGGPIRKSATDAILAEYNRTVTAGQAQNHQGNARQERPNPGRGRPAQKRRSPVDW